MITARRYRVRYTDGSTTRTMLVNTDGPAVEFLMSMTDEEAAALNYASAERWSVRQQKWVPAISWDPIPA